MNSLLVFGGTVIDPASGLNARRDVLIEDGLIAAVEPPGVLDRVAVAERLDATRLTVAPGPDRPARSPAGAGPDLEGDDRDRDGGGGGGRLYHRCGDAEHAAGERFGRDAAVDDLARARGRGAGLRHAGGHPGFARRDPDGLCGPGRGGRGRVTDDGKPILNDAIMRAALVAAARLGVPISQHAEDPRLSHGAIMNAGPVAFRLGLRGYPAEAEAIIVRRDLDLLRSIEREEKLRAHLHVQHVSTELALAAIRAAKAQGLHVTCEAAPHHFALTDEAIGNFDTNARMNPPLRSEQDRQAVIAGLKDGTIDCIATDHAPHALHEKEVEFERAPNGITGLETALGVSLKVLCGAGITVAQVLSLMTAGPARVLAPQTISIAMGTLGIGAWGDLLVLNADQSWVYRSSEGRSKSRNTPFEGATMTGRVNATVIGGRTVYRASHMGTEASL